MMSLPNENRYALDQFIGGSKATKQLLEIVARVCKSHANILITGESGVGKEMIAKTIHYNSLCHEGRFVGINCGAIPENLLESELFGYEKGAFTDAFETKKGLFEQASDGTIFLDEIGEMPINMQVKLLRVLEEGEVMRIGGVETIPINTRVICATNQNLEKMVQEGRFRQDLFYRINVVMIHVPNLRDRRADIPLFIDHALELYAQENEVPVKKIAPEAVEFLCHYKWPGNIRELINVMSNLSIFVEKTNIELSDLQERQELFQRIHEPLEKPEDPVKELTNKIDTGELTLSNAKQEFEKLQILRALRLASGKITTASKRLQMPRPQVSRLVKKYGLKEIIEDEEEATL